MLLDEPSEDEYGGDRKRRAVAVGSAAESHYARIVQECLGILPKDVYEKILAAITTFDSNLKRKRSIKDKVKNLKRTPSSCRKVGIPMAFVHGNQLLKAWSLNLNTVVQSNSLLSSKMA